MLSNNLNKLLTLLSKIKAFNSVMKIEKDCILHIEVVKALHRFHRVDFLAIL